MQYTCTYYNVHVCEYMYSCNVYMLFFNAFYSCTLHVHYPWAETLYQKGFMKRK